VLAKNAFSRVDIHNNDTDSQLIDIEQMSKHYLADGIAIPSIADINLRVEQGDILRLVGASGTWKNTLIRALNLIERPDPGAPLYA